MAAYPDVTLFLTHQLTGENSTGKLRIFTKTRYLSRKNQYHLLLVILYIQIQRDLNVKVTHQDLSEVY